MNFQKGETFYIDKPLGWTSFDAVKRVRGAIMRRLNPLGVRKIKVGHAGTLDPLATGVMIVVTGQNTKQIEALQSGVKTYRATLALGATTPSFDMETAIDATYPTDHITRKMVEEVLQSFVGTIQQTPPAYSACKVEGRRAYDYARNGEELALKPKTLIIDSIALVDYQQEAITIDVTCSKGTYIRALARDIGQTLHTGAYLTALRRTRVGTVAESDCLTPQEAARLIADADIELLEPQK